MIEIETETTDADGFMKFMTVILDGVIETSDPEAVFIVKIKGRFEPDAQGLSLGGQGEFGDLREDLALPAFEPSRVVEEVYWKPQAPGYWVETKAEPLHGSDPSADPKLALAYPTTAFIWWSGGSKRSGRGSVLIYLPTEEGHLPWYGEVRRDDGWMPVAAESE